MGWKELEIVKEGHVFQELELMLHKLRGPCRQEKGVHDFNMEKEL